MVSVNKLLLDRAIRHALFLEGLKASEVREILRFLNGDVLPDATERLAAKLTRLGRGPSTLATSRMRELVETLRVSLDTGFRGAFVRLRDALKDATVAEGRWQAKTLAGSVSLDFVTPAPVQLRALVSERPVAGEFLREWWKDESARTMKRALAQVRIGIVEGESIDNIVRRVKGTRAADYADGVWNTTRREVESFTRTAVGHYTAQARDLTYEANGDLIKGIQWVATLDLRTCPICASLDGTLTEEERPPAHPNCRCTTAPVLKSMEEIGVKARDLPEAERRTMDGKVPASTTLPEWLEGRSRAEQDEVLGPTRAGLWRSGELSLDQMVRGFRVLPLSELARLEGVEV